MIANSEASANLARFDGVRYGRRARAADNLLDLYQDTREQGFGPEVKRRIMLGTFALSSGYYDAYYGRACGVRRELERQFAAAYASVDVIVMPTSPTPAFAIGEKVDDPLSMYLSDIFTAPINLAGLPALAVPSGERPGAAALAPAHRSSVRARRDLLASGPRLRARDRSAGAAGDPRWRTGTAAGAPMPAPIRPEPCRDLGRRRPSSRAAAAAPVAAR